MPPKRKIDLPDHVRAALLADVAMTHKDAITADERRKVRIYLATEQGMDTYELAAALRISQTTVSKYRMQGKEILERRGGEREPAGSEQPGEDPVRPGELESVG